MTDRPAITSLEPEFLHSLFQRASTLYPNACAVDIPPGSGRPERRTISYAELTQSVNALAAVICRFLDRDRVVAILVPRDSGRLYAAQIAVLMAGGAYLCIDPSFPDDHVRRILEDAKPVAILADTHVFERAKTLDPGKCRVLNVDEVNLDDVPIRAPGWHTPKDLAYVIYTSGTTGAPKGVMIAHESIVNLVRSDLAEFGLGPGERVAQGSSPAYDSSVEEIWLALASGATVVLMDDETVRLGPDLVPWLRRERISVLCPPPTLLRSTGCCDPSTELPDLRLIYVGGEPLTSDVADSCGRGRRLVNGYGPTECTVTALRADVTPGEEIAIGKPVDGMFAWILDDDLNEVIEGEAGELCIGGIGLARGYRNRPDLTSLKFVEHREFGRIYRTGDLAHRSSDGNIYFHGRIDSQIKLRGYRIELEAIETTLAQMSGIREAACRLQTIGGRDELAAHIVPLNSADPPTFDDVRSDLAAKLPGFMVPSRFGFTIELPKSAGGKLNRAALPDLPGLEYQPEGEFIVPHSAAEKAVGAAFRRTLGIESDLPINADFFADLGGSSLLAAQLVSLLRLDPATASITVRDVYETRTIERLADRIGPVEFVPRSETIKGSLGRSGSATAIQSAWLLIELTLGSALGCVLVIWLIPWLLTNFHTTTLMLGWPILGLASLAVYLPVSLLAAIAAKRTLIGRYVPCRLPVWGGFFVRNWIVEQMVRLIPWWLFEGTELTSVALRALGARIGCRVHFHRGTIPLHGGWDLLEIGDDVTLAQDAAVRLVELEAGNVVVGPITLGDSVTIGVRGGVGPHTVMGQGSYLSPLSYLPPAALVPPCERWDCIPAEPAGPSPEPPLLPDGSIRLTPVAYTVALLAYRGLLSLLILLPFTASLFIVCEWLRLDGSAAIRILQGSHFLMAMSASASIVMIALPPTLLMEALAVRLMGKVQEGVISRWSREYIRVWLKSGLVESAGRWLSGTLFWPVWLRLAGMQVGSGCEISTIIDVVPELVEIDSDCFLADGIYLGPPLVHRGTVRLSRVHLSQNSFIGNHAVVPDGESLPEDILIGVCTVADQRIIRTGSSWFGLPPFELVRREVVECDRSLTHTPTRARYFNRVLWECLRVIVPAGPACSLVAWFQGIGLLSLRMHKPLLLAAGAPMVSLSAAGWLCVAVLMLKWALLGKVRPGSHPLWSCWCSRWDFLYVVWGEWARLVLASLEGTLLLNVYLRAMGMKIGRGVILASGFSQVVDPDMIKIGDGATVGAMFQAHTFEDRVLKIGEINIRPYATVASATVPLYGAEIGESTIVTAHSVVMKHERLLPGVQYEGAPTRPVATAITE